MAPSLIQRAVAKCVDSEVDVEAYNKNRELLYGSLLEMGYECIKPQGAFYLFVKALGGDDKAFCAKAKEFNLLWFRAQLWRTGIRPYSILR